MLKGYYMGELELTSIRSGWRNVGARSVLRSLQGCELISPHCGNDDGNQQKYQLGSVLP
jgi:hypothetical protein